MKSNSDKIGCFLSALGDAVQELDEKFGDENGNVKIEDITDAITLSGFAYSRFKTAFEQCLEKEFSINVPGTAGKIIELLLDLLAAQDDKKGTAL